MRVISTYPGITALCDKMQGKFDFDLWKDYALGISAQLPEMLAEDAKEYDFQSQIVPVLNAAINDRAGLEEINNSFNIATRELPQRLRAVFQTDLDVSIVLYLGLCNGAGWACKLEGADAVLIGIEKVHELDWGGLIKLTELIYHEIGHILHFVEGAGLIEPPAADKWLWQLFQEGIAMYCQQLLSGDSNSFHQNKGDWLDWCKANKNGILAEFKRRHEAGQCARDFFGDWAEWRGRSDLGYYLGSEFVNHLAKKRSPNELLQLDLATVKREFVKYGGINVIP